MASDAAPWPSKLGGVSSRGLPGFSPHVAPSDLNESPYFSVVDCVNIQSTPLIDAAGHIWLCGTFRNSFPGVIKLETWASELFRIRIEDQIVATPVLADGALYLAIDGGVAAAYDIDTGAERWTAKYAPGCGNDSWSIGHGQGTLVMAGKSNEAMPWNDSVYGVTAAGGAVKWRFQATLLMFFTPCLMHGAVIFQDMQCTVTSLRLADGSTSWQEKPKGHARSTGQAVLAKSLNTVFSAANRQAKKEWNAPYGGQGCIRAFDSWSGKMKWQQDFDLEANTVPTVAPLGAAGELVVVACLGASPGLPIKETATGDCWRSRMVALDAVSGALLWAHDFEPWREYGVRGSHAFNVLQPTVLTNPVAGGDGTLYVGWCGGVVFALRGSDGQVISGYDLGLAPCASPVIGPGFLVVASYQRVHIWKSWQDAQDSKWIMKDLQRGFEESGTEHFCPFKGGGESAGWSECQGPRDVSQPAWSYEYVKRSPNEFFYNSPVIDAQGKIYLTTRYEGLHVLGPDGSIRAWRHLGSALTNPALFGDALYLGTGDGWAFALDLQTLDTRWCRRYCCQANLDLGSAVATAGAVLLPGNASEIRNENKTMFCLDCTDGHTRWSFEVKGVGILNSRPVILDSCAIFADAEGGVYAVSLTDGVAVWETNKDAANHHRGVHLCAGLPDRAHIFTVGAMRGEPMWNRSTGGRSIIRCLDAGSGCKRWEKVFEIECLVPPVVVRKYFPLRKPMVIVAFGNGTGRPPRLTGEGPDGSNCTGDLGWGILAALDCENGTTNWMRSMPQLRSNAVPGSHADDYYLPPPFGAPVIGADGTLYMAWAGGLFCAIEACTGRLLSQYDMGCAAAGAPAIAPGLVCVMSAFRLLVWRDSGLEETWRNVAATEEDSRATVAQPAAPQDLPPDATWGVLRDVAAHRFDVESLRAYDWGQGVLKHELLRKSTEATVIRQAQAEDHKANGGPLTKVKALRKASLEAKAAAAAAPKEAPSAPGATRQAAAPAPAAAQPSWLQALGAASLLMEEEEEEQRGKPPEKQKPRWEVIGGVGKGGIVVRRGQDVNSPQLPSRVATGALVEELEISGDRLHFKKLRGDGPDSGWVSLTFQGKSLLKRV